MLVGAHLKESVAPFGARYTEPEVVLQWSLNPEVSGNMMHKIECTDCNSLRKCHIIHQTGLKVRTSFCFRSVKLC